MPQATQWKCSLFLYNVTLKSWNFPRRFVTKYRATWAGRNKLLVSNPYTSKPLRTNTFCSWLLVHHVYYERLVLTNYPEWLTNYPDSSFYPELLLTLRAAWCNAPSAKLTNGNVWMLVYREMNTLCTVKLHRLCGLVRNMFTKLTNGPWCHPLLPLLSSFLWQTNERAGKRMTCWSVSRIDVLWLQFDSSHVLNVLIIFSSAMFYPRSR